MKKIIFSLIMAMATSLCYGQIYSYKQNVDKFDDVLSEKSIKTLVTYTDTTITIEEKGSKPFVYKILFGEYAPVYKGSKEEPVNLINNVWGYECEYCVVPLDTITEFNRLQKLADAASTEAKIKMDENGNMSAETSDKTNYQMESIGLFFRNIKTIQHRVITTQFTKQYLREFLWIVDKDDNRTIYIKDY